MHRFEAVTLRRKVVLVLVPVGLSFRFAVVRDAARLESHETRINTGDFRGRTSCFAVLRGASVGIMSPLL